MGSADPELDEHIDAVIKNVLIESRGKITFYHDAQMWETLFWKEEDYRPDKVATSLKIFYQEKLLQEKLVIDFCILPLRRFNSKTSKMSICV